MRRSPEPRAPAWATLADVVTMALLALGAAVILWHPGWRWSVLGIRLSMTSGWRILAWAAIVTALRHGVVRTPSLPGRLIRPMASPGRRAWRYVLTAVAWDPAGPRFRLTRLLLLPIDGARALSGWIDRLGVGLLGLALVWLIALLVNSARATSFWHDEIYTILESDLPVATLWRASLDGIDLSPPLSTLLTHLLRPITGVGPIVTRLPAMTGVLAAVALLFIMVRRRANAAVGLAAVLGFSMTSAWPYALEARGYGLTIGLYAATLYGWSEAAAGRRAVLHWTVMAAALAAGVWTHYYFVLACLPILIGEGVRQVGDRRIHTAPWIALIGAALASLPLLPLAAAAAAQRGTFWARLRVLEFGPTYRYILADYRFPALAGGLLAAVAAVELARRALVRQWPRRLPAYEVAAGLACLGMPAAAVLVGFEVGAFDLRYAVFGVVGLALALPLVVWALTPRNGLGDLVLLVTLAASFVGFSHRSLDDPAGRTHPYAAHPLLADWLRHGDPIVITGGVDYLALWYYAPESARPLALYLVDPAGQLRDTGSDTSDRGYLALMRWTPVSVVPIGEFVRTHRRFWLYSLGTTWVEETLRSWGATLTERGVERSGAARLFEVRLPDE